MFVSIIYLVAKLGLHVLVPRKIVDDGPKGNDNDIVGSNTSRACSTAVLAAREVSRGFHDFLNSDAPGTLGEERDSGHVAGKLSEALWAQLVHLFGTTASMDASDRFHFIAKSLRPTILDTLSLNQDPKFVERLEDFTDALGSSLREAWCAHRDAYLVHGDATPILGEASKVMHTFVRQTLKVPLMATHNLKTPASNELLEESGTAPTVGSYTGAVYRALRDGTLFKVAMDLVYSCVPQESEEH
ncbi:L-Aspartase-like protein [Apiospora arundinis]|uniref:L-Aspartase-like protein n=1 Tax=Apiospora arundinis TaxID=335852 RepID=A0ABR2I8U4_9PEZI